MLILLVNVTFDLEPLGFIDVFWLRKPYNLIAKMKLFFHLVHEFVNI